MTTKARTMFRAMDKRPFVSWDWLKPLLLSILSALLAGGGIVKFVQSDTVPQVVGARNAADQNSYDLKVALWDIENLKLRVKQLEAGP